MVQSRVEDLSPVVKKLSVELAPDAVAAELDQAYGRLSRTVKLKGYRPGHVPRRVVERYFADEVKKDVAQRLVQTSIGDALTEHKLDPVAPPRVENGDVAPGQPFKYVATVEVRPRVEPKDYVGLPLKKADTTVADAEVDERLEQLRKEHAVFAPVEGRDVVEAGDFAIVDYAGTVDGAPLKGGTREGVALEVVPGTLLDNKAEALLGARVGEGRELAATFPADYAVEELRGKEARFQATVRAIKRRDVPALDDEFVKDLGGEAKTVAELRERVRSEMAQVKKERAESEQREKLLEALVERNPVEAPPALVERNVDAMLQGMVEGFARRGLDLTRMGVNLDRMRDDLRGRALLEVKGFLLLDAIAEKEGLAVADDDYEKHYQKLADELGQPVDRIRTALRRQGVDSLTARLRQDKALAFLLEKANLE